MKRMWRGYVADMLTAVQEVEDFTRGMEYENFAADRKTVNAVVRSLEIMGEAAKRIPEDVRQRYPGVPWKRNCRRSSRSSSKSFKTWKQGKNGPRYPPRDGG